MKETYTKRCLPKSFLDYLKTHKYNEPDEYISDNSDDCKNALTQQCLP